MRTGQKKVLVFGTFDLLHKGHHYFLRQAKKYGTQLNVVVAKGATVRAVKGRKTVQSEAKRIAELKSLRYVDKVYLGSIGDKYAIIEKIKPDVICLGYDQKRFTDGLLDELVKRNISAKIVRIGSYKSHMYKTTLIRKYH